MTIVNDIKQDTAKTGHEVISTGFSHLDALIGGWHKGELVLIGGRPAMGKTTFITSSLINLSIVNNIPTAMFSLEMNSQQVTERIRRGLCDGMGESVCEAEVMLSLSPIILNDECSDSNSIERVRRLSRSFKETYGIRFVYIDYLQLLHSEGRGFVSQEKEVGYIVNELRAMATELDITVICCYQTKRSTEEGVCPNIEHFRYIPLARVDTVIAIHRPEYYKLIEDARGNDLRGFAEFLVLKSKYGKEGNTWLKFSSGLFYEHTRKETKEYAVFRKIENRNIINN